MKLFSTDEVKEMQRNPSFIRNLCILAHVDHGKTTLADSLVASNGIISKRMAGKLRYMDSRKDEQQRGITMKSSCISLGHVENDQRYLINLIDSPGHVDFCGEVSAAVRLCDGALILVDVVEGICSQTQSALRQARIEGLTPILVLNKMDRLILEKKLTALDAYVHIQQIVEQVNAIMGGLFTSEVLLGCNLINEKLETQKAERAEHGDKKDSETNKETTEEYTYDWSSGLDEKDDSHLYFVPESGNVIFASAMDGWGFTVRGFSRVLSQKLGMSEQVLNKTLWGDFCLDSKHKRIMKGAQAKAKKPLFVQLVLENIWMAYEAVAVRRDKPVIEKIVKSLNLNITPRDLNHTDYRVQLQAIFGQWLPLSSTVLSVVCEHLPSPLDLTGERVERLMCSNLKSFESLPRETQSLRDDFVKCSSAPGSVKIACISKMICVDRSLLPENKFRILTPEEIAQRRAEAKARLELKQAQASDGVTEPEKAADEQAIVADEASGAEQTNEVFIAFARVFSGVLRQGDEMFVLGPKYDPSKHVTSAGDLDTKQSKTLSEMRIDQHVTTAKIGRLFVLMGRELEALDEVRAGNVCGIEGLEEYVLKSATLSDSLYCPPFIDLHVSAQPILRVAIEPQNPNEMPQLIKGLRLLNQADPNVHVMLQDSGEHVVVTTGEVHLQKCIDDLSENFAKIKLNVSKPIVPFRETIVTPPKVDMVNEAIDDKNHISSEARSHANNESLIHVYTPNKRAWLKMRALPLPDEVTSLLDSRVAFFKQVFSKTGTQKENLKAETLRSVQSFKEKLEELLKDAGGFWKPDMIGKIWSFGPKYCGPNILFNMVPGYQRETLWESNKKENQFSSDDVRRTLDSSFVSGFQLASLAGPLCEEPMIGVAFVVEEWHVPDEMDISTSDPYGPFSGQIMSTVKEACRRAFQAQPQRVKIAMYSCTIQVASDALGKMYAVVGRRSGRVLHADLQEGSQTFTVTTVVPVIESFQLGDELRKQTSGMACPQLVFSHWETLDLDPFWVPSTEEEYTLYGEKADTENRARKYMNYVRRRKGLALDEKVVPHAEKQRTLTRNNEDSRNESNRLRLINRQKQLLESKRQRQQQVVATVTRQPIRPVKSASLGRSNERLLLQPGSDDSVGGDGGLVNPSLSPEDEPVTSLSTVRSSPLFVQSGKVHGERDSDHGQTSPLGSSSPEDLLSPIGLSHEGDKESGDARRPSSSGDEASTVFATGRTGRLAPSSLVTKPLAAASTADTAGHDLAGHDANPLVNNLSSKELLAFVSRVILPHQVMQCTIIRDKRGIDRSLYPTYFLHLQAIVNKNKKNRLVDDQEKDQESGSSDKDTEATSSAPGSGGGRPGESRKHSTTTGMMFGGNKSAFLLCGRRRKKSKTYLIASDPFDISRANCVAKLKSNVLGTQFNALRLGSNGQRYEMATIIYEANVLGFKGPRKMTVLHPEPGEEPMVCLYDSWKRNKDVVHLKNKTPVWNEDSQSYVLNFHGRVTQASVKNFQLVQSNPNEDIGALELPGHPDANPVVPMWDEPHSRAESTNKQEPALVATLPLMNCNPHQALDEDIVMQFGRVSDKEFTCDVTHPLTLLQAFAIALSSFDSKLACE